MSFDSDCDSSKDSCLSRREVLDTGLRSGFAMLAAQALLGRNLARADDAAKAGATPSSKSSSGVRSIVFIYLAGGPSHIDTFDPKPGAETGGPFKAIETSVSGARISEHLPKLAGLMKHMNLINSMSSKEGSHDRARHVLQSGYAPAGPVRFPGFGSIVAREHSPEGFALPSYVAIGGAAQGSGYLGARYSPFAIANPAQPVANLVPPMGVDSERFERRKALLEAQERDFGTGRNARLLDGHRETYARTHAFMSAEGRVAFEISREAEKVRAAYGDNRFGQGCLLARRLVEVGVPFVNVTLGGWDTHQSNFPKVQELSTQLDSGLGQLIQDLVDRGLLDSTIVICAGEFGRTPRINPNAGRDHYPRAFSALIGGGGLKKGQKIGATDDKGATVVDQMISPPDLYATIAEKIGLARGKVYHSDIGRPFRLVHQDAKLVDSLL